MMLIFSHVRRVSAIIGYTISHCAIYQSQLRYSIIDISKISMFLSVSLLPLLFASSFQFRLNKVGPWMNPSPPPSTKSRESRAIMFFSL